MQHHETQEIAIARSSAGHVLSGYLFARAGDFLRGLRCYTESGSDTLAAEEAARSLGAAARRISGSLQTYRSLLDGEWADSLRTELGWLSGTLAQEHTCTARLERLVTSLARLSGSGPVPPPRAEGRTGGQPSGALTVGAARAGALLERQLTLARTRSHSAALQALGSSRFHAVADAVAVLASEVQLAPTAGAPADEMLIPPCDATERVLLTAVTALPLARAAHPYNAEALVHGLADTSEGEAQDAPWHQVRRLLRLHRYAREVVREDGADSVLTRAGRALDQHRDAAAAAEAAAAAARTPRIAPATAYALGVLHADQRLKVAAARFAFQQAWQQMAVTTP